MKDIINILFILALVTLPQCCFSESDSQEEDDEAVKALTDSSFDSFVEANGFVLAEFYAPWCGHCKQLAPEYEKAAQELKNHDPPVQLVKIDATVEKELGSRYEISGYPTLKFFRDGKPEEYDGPRDSAGIVDWVKSRSDPNYKPPPEAVVTLESQGELDEFTRSSELTLVEFYAPWCGHCKKLAPEYEKAAKALLNNDPPIRLAKMDGTVHKDAAEKYGISGFPTLFIFRAKPDAEGEIKVKQSLYDGPREERGIVEHMIKQSGDPAKLIANFKELKSRLHEDDVIVVGVFSSTDSKTLELYQDAVNIFRDKYDLYFTTDSGLRKRYKLGDRDAVIVIMPELMVTKYDKPYYVLDLTPDTESSAITGFIDAHQTPLIGTRTQKNKERYSKRPLCILFVPVDWSHEYRDMTASWRNKLLPVANKYRKDFYFAMSDDETSTADIKSFGFEDSGSDFSLGCFGVMGEKYPMEELDEWDEYEVAEFLEQVKKGKAKTYLKSQIPPKKQTTPVLTVTGKTFNEIVMDPSKDVLIELYAPWCGHCKKFEPEFKKLAKELSSEKNLVLAKMNAEANDSPDMYEVKGFPTLYFAPANQKELPIKYDGNRDLDDLKKFMKEHSNLAFKSVKEEL